jgi:hypothetical protein
MPGLHELPWTTVFTSYLVRMAGNPHDLSLGALASGLWISALERKLTFVPGERMPALGDLAFFGVTPRIDGMQGPSIGKMRSGESHSWPALTGVVYAVDGNEIVVISGNVHNMVASVRKRLDDPQLIGFVRLPP